MRTILGILCAVSAVAQQSANPVAYPAAKHGGQYMQNYYMPPAPSTTPWAPAWSPDGSWIAVGMQGSLWKVDPASGTATELTEGAKYYSSPTFSPDGKWLVYTADDDARSIQLEVLNLETGQSHALTNDDEIYLDPVFSPDGTRIAYVSTRPNGYFNIFVRGIRDGRWSGEEIALTRDNRYPRDRLYFGAWDMHTQPAWSRDGSEIFFVSNRGVPLGSGDLMRMPVQEDGILKAKPVLQEQTLYRTRPDVSIDGKRILYSSTSGTADQFNHLYVLPVHGGAPYKLTFGDYDDFHPRWSPDGEWVAYISNEGGLPQLYLLETYGGARKRVAIRERRWKRPVGKLHVRVLDASGVLTPARIQGVAADGRFYAPVADYSRIGRSGLHSFHTAGEYSVEVPAGKMRVQAVKGFQYLPAAADVEIRPGQVAELRLKLERPERLAWKGWRSGSTHVHMNYGGNLHNTPENLLRMARAEGLDIVFNQVANKDNRVLDYQYFVPGGGEHPASKGSPDVKLLIGQEYRPPFYGHMSFLGLRDHLISPFTTGYEGTAIESLYPSNTDMLRKARAQGALTGYVHAFSGDRDPLETSLGVGKSFPVDAALGTVHTLEWSAASRAALQVWHHVLNNDFQVAPVGGEDSISNLHRVKLVGSVRTYAYTGPDTSVEGWLEAAKKGLTFFSTGPLLDLRINGSRPGEAVQLPPGGGAITIEGSAESIAPLSKVLLYHNGRVFRELPLSGHFRETVQVTGSGWFSLYAEGPYTPPLDGEYPQAATNAIRVYVGDRKIRNRASAEYFVRWIDKLESMANAWPWWRSEKERKHVLAQFAEARAIYKARAEESVGETR